MSLCTVTSATEAVGDGATGVAVGTGVADGVAAGGSPVWPAEHAASTTSSKDTASASRQKTLTTPVLPLITTPAEDCPVPARGVEGPTY